MGARGPKAQPARLVRWKGAWRLVWRDGAGREHRERCDRHGATSAQGRLDLLRAKLVELDATAGEVRRRGGALAYDTPLGDALARYRAHVLDQQAVRVASPSSREGLSAAAGVARLRTLDRFTAWLKARGQAKLPTGHLDAALLRAFFQTLATETAYRGSTEIQRSAATLNKHRRELRACFRWLAELRPPLFPDFPALAPAFKLRAGDSTPARAFAPATLRAFLQAALEYESPARTVAVARRRAVVALPDGRRLAGGDLEAFAQPAPSTAATPVSRLFLLLALTGMRLGEALGLRWSDCDLERGRLTVRAQKTGRLRIVPLTGAPEGEVAPGLVGLLRRWKLEAGGRVHVLPHGELEAPALPKSAWQAVNKLAGVERVGPQMLRQSFVSYAASCGVPAAVAALWSGHAAAVAERWYRAQVLDRAAGGSLEAAMGLATSDAVLSTRVEA